MVVQDDERWLAALRAREDGALAELRALLLRAARFELRRRGVPARELDDLVEEAADDAMVAILRKLDAFRGDSRFTTWAYKFALLEAAVKARRRAWRDREVPLEDTRPAPGPTPHERLEERELLDAVRTALGSLTDRQRTVFTALALNEVPIDVLAERMGTTRGALYKSLHDARRALRVQLGGQYGL